MNTDIEKKPDDSTADEPEITYDPAVPLIEKTGYIMTGVTIAVCVAFAVARPDPYAQVWQLYVAHMVTGGAGNIGYGLELEFPSWFLMIQCTGQDILILYLFYPLLMAGYKRATERRFLGQILMKIRKSAQGHRAKIARWGIPGLMVFVVFPFWSTGPLVGAVVGFLVGMRTRVTFTAVILGNIVAVALWVFLFQWMRDLSINLTRFILIAILTGVILSLIVHQIRRLIIKARA